jgi:hypothetical protein
MLKQTESRIMNRKLLRNFLIASLVVVLAIPAIGQNQKLYEGRLSKGAVNGEPVPMHVSHILNSPEFLARFGQLDRTKPLAKAALDTLNTIQTFKFYNFNTESFDDVEFKLVRKGAVSQLWFATAEIANGHLTEDVADTMILYLESKTNPDSYDPDKGVIALGNEIFGNPPDYDNDGLSDVFVGDVLDSYDPEGSSSFIAGFFFSIDQTQDSNSNKRDVIYIDSYPGVYNPNTSTANPLRPLSTLSHEYQHLIHFNYYTRLGINQYTFLNEAQSNFASLLTGFYPHSSALDYMANTNVSLFRWNTANVLPEYGRAAVFSSYLWDRWGFENAGNLTSSGLVGVAGIEAALSASGSSWTFEDLLVNWAVANYVNDTLATGNRDWGYNNPIISSWRASPTMVISNPDVSNTDYLVVHSAAAYLVYKGVKNLSATVSWISPVGRAKVITKRQGEVTVSDLANGVAYNSPTDIEYEEIVLMLVNTQPSGTGPVQDFGIFFTYSSSGDVAYEMATASTYSQTPEFYWAVPYYNASQVGRFGFTNKFVVDPGGELTKMNLYTVTGIDGGTQLPIEVKGEGQMRLAVYTDNAGLPGTVFAEDTVDFNDIGAEWNSFDVSDWNFVFGTNEPFHVAYEFIVPVVDSDINSVPLRLDDGNGIQNVARIITNASPFTTVTMFTSPTPPNGQHNVWNQIEYRYDPATSIAEEDINTPVEFALAQNYPNPFNPNTIIKYQIPKSGQVELTIYNSLGQKVQTLISEQKTAGVYEVSWDGRNDAGKLVGSGVYFYRLKSADRQIFRKMILLR